MTRSASPLRQRIEPLGFTCFRLEQTGDAEQPYAPVELLRGSTRMFAFVSRSRR